MRLCAAALLLLCLIPAASAQLSDELDQLSWSARQLAHALFAKSERRWKEAPKATAPVPNVTYVPTAPSDPLEGFQPAATAGTALFAITIIPKTK
jgi:hypothetical protein